MKKLITIILTLLTTVIWGQDTINNFKVDGNEIIWQKVYETTMTINQLQEKILDSGIFRELQMGENKISGDIKPIDAEYKRAGYSEMGTPVYIARSSFTGFIIFDLKEGKYRVTLKKIVLTQKYDDTQTKQGQKTNLEYHGFKNNKIEFTNTFKKSASLILNYTFTDKYEFKYNQKKEEW